MKVNTMKAAVFHQYGAPQVMKIEVVNKPFPKKNELLIQIKATAVNTGDVRLRKADPFIARFFTGLLKPKKNILGSVYSGIVEKVGSDVKFFKVGDKVFGHTQMDFGTFAEYICQPETGTIALKPENISHEEAASIPFGAVTALYYLRKAKIKPHQKLLVVGASGAVGSAAVQLAKAMGAEVTGVCSTTNVALVKSIGADHVIDYTKEDFTQLNTTYDMIFDAVNAISLFKSAHRLNKNGKFILSAANLDTLFKALYLKLFKNISSIMGMTYHKASDLHYIVSLIESGKYLPVLDKTYPLDEMVQAHAYVDLGHKKGNVAIAI